MRSMSSDPHQLAPKGPNRPSLLPCLGHMDWALAPDQEALLASSAHSLCRLLRSAVADCGKTYSGVGAC
jgi:hypothetical protein